MAKINHSLSESERISQVLAVCPEADLNSVKLDLTFTGNAEQTINRIFDGTALVATSGEDLSTTDINSDSSLDLPIIKIDRSKEAKLKERLAKLHELQQLVVDSDSDCEEIDINKSSSISKLPGISTDLDKKFKHNQPCSSNNSNTNSSKANNDRFSVSNETDIVDLCSTSKSFSNSKRLESIDLDMNSDDENDISIHTYQTQIRNTDACLSSDDELPDLELPSLARRCQVKSSRAVFSDLYGNSESTSQADDVSTTTTIMSDISGDVIPQKKPTGTGKRKRTPEEIIESKRQALLKKEEKQKEKDEKKAQKDREAQLRKMESENKKAFRPGDCLKKITVSLDPGIINTGSNAGLIFKTCEDLGVKCETLPQTIPNSITWKREVIEYSEQIPSGSVKLVTEEDIIIMIPLPDFITMVKAYSQKQKGDYSCDVTFTEFIQSLQSTFTNNTFTFFVHGLDKYFSDLKLIKKQKHKEAVLETGSTEGAKVKKRKMAVETVISRIEVEEAMVDSQLLSGCVVQFLDTPQQIADLIRTFTKAVAEKPAKRGRLENVFNFLEEGSAGVKVDKNGQGLLKVFKHQLMQFKNLGPDMADAILGVYPSPRLLIKAYNQCSSEKEKEKLLENIMVRRGGGVLATNRRVGKEMSKRIHLYFTTIDPNFVIK